MTARGAGGGAAFVRLRSRLVLDRASPCELDNGRFGVFQFSVATVGHGGLATRNSTFFRGRCTLVGQAAR